MVTTVVLANTSILSHNYHFFYMVGTIKFQSLKDFEVHNSVLLSIMIWWNLMIYQIPHKKLG